MWSNPRLLFQTPRSLPVTNATCGWNDTTLMFPCSNRKFNHWKIKLQCWPIKETSSKQLIRRRRQKSPSSSRMLNRPQPLSTLNWHDQVVSSLYRYDFDIVLALWINIINVMGQTWFLNSSVIFRNGSVITTLILYTFRLAKNKRSFVLNIWFDYSQYSHH